MVGLFDSNGDHCEDVIIEEARQLIEPVDEDPLEITELTAQNLR